MIFFPHYIRAENGNLFHTLIREQVYGHRVHAHLDIIMPIFICVRTGPFFVHGVHVCLLFNST